jgi:hypothetical protein
MAYQEKLRKDQNDLTTTPITTSDKPDDGVKFKKRRMENALQSNKKHQRSLFGTHQGEMVQSGSTDQIVEEFTEDGESGEFSEVIKSLKEIVELCDIYLSKSEKAVAQDNETNRYLERLLEDN